MGERSSPSSLSLLFPSSCKYLLLQSILIFPLSFLSGDVKEPMIALRFFSLGSSPLSASLLFFWLCLFNHVYGEDIAFYKSVGSTIHPACDRPLTTADSDQICTPQCFRSKSASPISLAPAIFSSGRTRRRTRVRTSTTTMGYALYRLPLFGGGQADECRN